MTLYAKIYDLDLTTPLGVIGDIEQGTYTNLLSDKGGFRLVIPRSTNAIVEDPAIFNKGNFVEIWHDDALRFGGLIDYDKDNVVNRNETGRTFRIAGPDVGSAYIKRARVYPKNWPSLSDPDYSWTTATPGTILLDIISDAQARGTISLLTTSFTATLDTTGNAWSASFNLVLKRGMTYLQVLDLFKSLGFDWEITPDLQLNVWNRRGTDRTLQSEPPHLINGLNVEMLDRSEKFKDPTNVILLEGDDGQMWESEDSTSSALYDRHEGYVSNSGMIDQTSADAIANPILSDRANPKVDMRISFVPSVGSIPYVDWDIGDDFFVSAAGISGVNKEKHRAVGITYRQDKGNKQAWIAHINEVAVPASVVQARQLGILDLSSATPVTTPVDAPPDGTVPKSPTGLALATGLYVAEDGTSRGYILATWNKPTQNTDNSAITDGSHHVAYLSRQGQTGDNTVWVPWDTESALWEELTPGETVDVFVESYDLSGNVSAPTAVVSGVVAPDTIAPGKPAPPSVAGNPLEIQVTHTLGLDSGGEWNLPLDMAEFEVYVDTSTGFTPDKDPVSGGYNYVGSLPVTAGHITSQIPAIGSFQVVTTATRYVRVVAVDLAGNESDPSDEVTVTAELISNAHISNLSATKLVAGTIDAGDITIASTLIVDGSGETKSGDYVAGSAGWRIADGAAEFNIGTFRNSVIIGLDGVTDGAGVTVIDGGKITADSITGAKIAADQITGDHIVAKTIFAQHLTHTDNDNLIPNPGAELGTFVGHHLVDSGGTWSIKSGGTASAYIRSGEYSFFYDPGNPNTMTGNGRILLGTETGANDVNNWIPVGPNDRFFLECWVRASDTVRGEWNRIEMIARWRQADGTASAINADDRFVFGETSQPHGASDVDLNGDTITEATWRRIGGTTGGPPSDASFVFFEVLIVDDGSPGTWAIEDIMARRKVALEIIGDLASDSYDGTGNEDGTTGWHLGEDGNFEAHDGTFRGVVTGGEVRSSVFYAPDNTADTRRLVIGEAVGTLPNVDTAIQWWPGGAAADSEMHILPWIEGRQSSVNNDPYPILTLNSGEVKSGTTLMGDAGIDLEGGIIGNDRAPRIIFSVGSADTAANTQIRDSFFEFNVVKSGASSTNASIVLDAPDNSDDNMYLHTPDSGIKFLGSSGEVQVRNGDADSAYAIIRASSFPVGSDRRFKSDIVPAGSQLQAVLDTAVSEFRMNDRWRIGFVADDLQEDRNVLDPQGYGGWDLADEVARLYKAVQELSSLLLPGRAR